MAFEAVDSEAFPVPEPTWRTTSALLHDTPVIGNTQGFADVVLGQMLSTRYAKRSMSRQMICAVGADDVADRPTFRKLGFLMIGAKFGYLTLKGNQTVRVQWRDLLN
jgi:hypothetical protein